MKCFKSPYILRLSLMLIGILLTGFSAQAVEIDYKALYKKTSPSVVLLYGTDGEYSSRGTGSIIDDMGLVLTNTHVVVKDGQLWEKQFVFLKPEQVTGNPKKDYKRGFAAEVLAVNPEFDLALVQIVNPPNDLKPLPLSDLNQVGIGEPTVAIGHPGGGAAWSLTTGKISASWENYREKQGWDVYQTETSINPGNSGGPLLDGSGAVIGINTFIIRKGQQGLALTGLNFAVKSTTARDWIVSIMGELPLASTVKTKEKSLPSIGEVDNADGPTNPKGTVDPYVKKGDTDEKRDSKLEEPSQRESEYSHSEKGKPGTVILGSKIDTLEKIKAIHDIFDNNEFNQ